ncbi:MAG TPA: hypothetical protein VF648_06505 [Pyrinomonadaceae bacterium]|jgi:hypothetical protein
MQNQQFQSAAQRGQELLVLYSPNKPPKFALNEAGVLQPAQTIQKALSEAQFILNETSTIALKSRISSLAKSRKIQRIINGLHLITGSGFVLLIANQFAEPTKWIGALISLGAGILALLLPGDPKIIEQQVFEDINTVSALSGEIARIQTIMLTKNPETDEKLSSEIATLIGKCIELSRKYELDKIAQENGGVYPRVREEAIAK